ncbi:hypothetical protein ACFSL6_03780 [Paenibacillus thailandensis]|uniref:Uncharacterized protein n=1 Tax=Paenibacillus thailandensis TaxID=393250 RepID=A0ABW5R494_9BACL
MQWRNNGLRDPLNAGPSDTEGAHHAEDDADAGGPSSAARIAGGGTPEDAAAVPASRTARCLRAE